MPSELRVFAQSGDVDIDAWDAHARRFFATRLGFADEIAGPRRRLVVAPDGRTSGIRTTFVRTRTEADLADAEAAEARAGGGLVLLARRCGAVWTVEREGAADPLALRLAAIVASLVLGPIFDPEDGALFGVKTARDRLARLERGTA